MGTPRQLTQVAFAAPLDESTEDEILDPTAGFPVLENVRQDKRGGLSKRLGFAAESAARYPSGTRTAGRRLFDFGDQYCVSDGATLDVIEDDTAVSAGRISEATVTTRTLAISMGYENNAAVDIATCNGFLVTILSPPVSTVLYASVETLDGTVLLPTAAIVGAITTASVATVGNYVVVVYGGSPNGMYLRALDCTSTTTIAAGWGTEVTMTADRASGKGFSLHENGATLALVYPNTSVGTSRLTVRRIDQTGSIESATVNTSSTTPDVVGAGGSSADTLWVAWNQGTDVYACGFSPSSLASVLATTALVRHDYDTVSANLIPHIVRTGAGTAALVLGASATGTVYSEWSTSAGSVSLGTAVGHLAGCTPFSRSVVINDRRYGIFGAQSVDGGGFALCDWTDIAADDRVRPVAYAFPLLTIEPSGHGHIIQIGTYRYAYATVVKRSSVARSVEMIVLDFADVANTATARHNGQVALSGGVTTYLDRRRVVEANFIHAPSWPEFLANGVGVGPTGDVRYVAVYEDVDSSGNYNVSGVSRPSLVVTGVGNDVDMALVPLSITMRDTVRVSLYRTKANGSTYYYVGSAENDTTPGIGAPYVTITDTYDDTDLGERPLLLGTGNLPGSNGAPLQHDAPPFSQDVVSYNEMLVIASGSDLWWSGQTIGGEGAWFSTEQFFVTIPGAGHITALAALDGSLYVFKERSIYVIGGEPPSDNGAAGGLGQPRQLASDVGCIRRTSLVVSSLGVLFQSHRGIELLSGGRPSWIGEKVVQTLDDYPVVTSAVIDEHNNLIRISCARSVEPGGSVTGPNGDDPTDVAGKDLIFDLTLGAWQSTDIKTISGGSFVASQDACIIGGRYAWLSSDGIVYTETDEHTDDGQYVPMRASTAWWKLAGIQGRQMFNRLLTLLRRHTDCGLTVEIGYEYRDDYATTVTRTPAQLQAVEDLDVPLQLRTDPDDSSEGQAIRVRLTDIEPTGEGESVGTGRGATWLALTLDITPKEGPAEVPEEAA